MKKFKLVIFLMLIAAFTYAQQVDRDQVILEIGTGTWCYYCPGAALGAEDMIANGKQVAVVEYHGGGVDNYINEYSTARISYYSVTGYPTAFFDGGNSVIGGSHTNSMYSTYLTKYNQRINTPSSFTIDMVGSKIGTNDYQVTVTATKVATAPTANLVLHFVVTESNIVYSWQGLTDLNFVERLMVPDQTGTDLDFSTGDVKQMNMTFSLDPSWVSNNCEVICFIQNSATKEVFQGAKSDLSEFNSTNNIDAAIVSTGVPGEVCQNTFVPKIKIGNYGTDNLTSLDITAQINNGTPVNLNWTGNLPFMGSEIVELPEISFTMQTNNSCTISCTNPNGQTDQYPSNDELVIPMESAMNVTSPVSLALKLDDNPEETTWALYASDGSTLYSGGPYSQAGQFVVQSFVLPDDDCYTFVIDDAGENGLSGAGLFKLAYSGSNIFAEGKNFGFEQQVEFGIGLTGVESHKAENGFSVYPNPVVGNATVSFVSDKTEDVQLSMYNTLGALVYQSPKTNYSAGQHNIAIERNDMEPGIYFIQLKQGDKLSTQKIVLR